MARDASTQFAYADAAVAAAVETMLVLRSRRKIVRRPWLVGLSGLQGSGKSTLARQCAARANARGKWMVVLSLDDFYFGRRDRKALARTVHPLLATRGVPGTHDIALLMQTLDALANATGHSPARIPRFDKGTDTRLPPSRWRSIPTPPVIVLLEGWCVGVPAQVDSELVRSMNVLERVEDRNGHWRRWVNAQLKERYEPLWSTLDMLVTLEAPNFSVVRRWREEQERTLRKKHAPHAMDPTAVARFVMHYQRLSHHALRTLPDRTDLRIVLDGRRTIRAMRMR